MVDLLNAGKGEVVVALLNEGSADTIARGREFVNESRAADSGLHGVGARVSRLGAAAYPSG